MSDSVPTPTPQSPVAIIGISCIFPKADDLQSYWSNIKNGVDAIGPIPEDTHWKLADYHNSDPKSPDKTYAARGGFINPVHFNPLEHGISPKDIEATDTTQLLGMVAAKQALDDAGYGAGKKFDRNRTSVILGVTGTLELVIPLGARLGHPIWRKALKEAGVDPETSEDVVQRISDSYVGWQENSFPGLLGNVVAGRISNRLDLGGTNCVVDAACASSLSALHLATMELASGKSDMVITGGLDTFNDIFMYVCFSKTPALSPTGNARPFDQAGDGTILGEGIGIVVLKRLADAERDGDRIYAVIKGVGASSDGKGNAVYAPSSPGQVKALKRAYENGGVTPESIEMVEGHGTGTKVGDGVEVTALTEVYGEKHKEGSWCALGSVKSQIGHTKAAAGVAGLIKTALALHHKVLPPTIKVTAPLEQAAPGKSPFYVNTSKRPWLPREEHPRRAAVSAFGFGGSNFHCVLEESGNLKPGVDWDGETEIIALSGESRAAIQRAAEAWTPVEPWLAVRRAAEKSRREFNSGANCRLLLLVEHNRTDLPKLLAQVRTMFENYPDRTHWWIPEGAAFGSGPVTGKLGVLFPGQGSQYPGMMRDLACQFPEAQDVLADANRIFEENGRGSSMQRLSDYIYPLPTFSEEGARAQESDLKATDVAQPAIGAVSLGAFRVLESFGVLPEAAAGHSYGELTALCASGRLEAPTLHALSNVRGRLMNGSADGDRGAMLAVQAPVEKIEAFLLEEKIDLIIANRNAPDQAVLAGAVAAIDHAAARLEVREIRHRKLTVAAAFHSPFVAEAQKPFFEALERVDIGHARIPVYANTTAREYPGCPDEARSLLAGQLAKPVEFVAEIEEMFASGVTTFVEAGPGHALTDLVQSILKGKDVHAIALDSSSGKKSGTGDLARTLIRLASLGYTVNLAKWEAGTLGPLPATTGKPAFTVPVSGANKRSSIPARPPVTPKAIAVRPPSSPSPVPSLSPSPVALPTVTSSSADLGNALRVTRDSLVALQQLQEQTAQLHRKFLEGQETAQQTFRALIGQQSQVLTGSPVTAIPSFTPATTPAQAAIASVPVCSALPQPRLAAAPVSNTRFSEVLLGVVAEKTGYPVEMLNLSMGLDSDLGIDSIKRVEIMSLLRDKLPDAPEIKPEHLGVLQTLQQIVDFLGTGSGSPVSAEQPKALAVALDAGLHSRTLLEIVAEKTGYPSEMLNLEMGLDADLGIDSIKRVEIMSALRERLPQAPEIKPEHLGTLQTLRQIVEFLGAGEALTDSVAPVLRAGLASNKCAEVLLEIVAEKTGYPSEMLNLEMGLDADLGIDSIKRVEIMSALRERLPDAPEIKPEHLGTLHTLRQIVEFLGAGESSAPLVAPSVTTSSGHYAAVLLEIVAEKTGYPVEMLNLGMGLDADLGIDSIKRVEIMSTLRERLPDAPEIKPEHLGTLQTLQEVVDFLGGGNETKVDKPVTVAVAEPAKATPPVVIGSLERLRIEPVLLNGSHHPVKLRANAEIWITEDGSNLAALVEENLRGAGYRARRAPIAAMLGEQRPEGMDGLIILPPASGTNDQFLAEAFRLVRFAGAGLRAAGEKTGSVLLTVSRLDGAFGFGEMNGKSDPMSGGLAGLAKTARHEWPQVRCMALDLDPAVMGINEAARSIVEELQKGAAIEVGVSGTRRVALELRAEPISLVSLSPLEAGEVILISGGGRGVTASAAQALAKAFRPTLVLLGRSPLEPSEPAWLSSLQEEAQIKKAIHARLNGTATPKNVESEYRQRMANREVLANIARMEQAGARVVYRAVDVRDASAVRLLVDEIRREFGAVRGVIHGAGVLADRRIEDKTDEQFEAVYSTKVAGLRALLEATEQDDLKVLALFSSFTGRHGRTGQVAYAVANEVLNKTAQAEARRRPSCRVVSVNWGPWNGGMVTPALRKVFAQEGIGLIEPEAGADYLVREICQAAPAPVEIMVLGPTPAGGGSLATSKGPELVAFARDVNVTSMPCLTDHVIGGKAVLPVALIVELLSHGALHSQPGLVFTGLDDLKIFKGVLAAATETVSTRVVTGTTRKEGQEWLVSVELISGADGSRVLHAGAVVRLGARLDGNRPERLLPLTQTTSRIPVPAYSDETLFHGPAFQGIESLEVCDPRGIVGTARLAPAPREWIVRPLRAAWIADPLALDAAFQMIILWTHRERGLLSLPTALGRYRQFVSAFPRDGVRINIRVIDSGEHRASAQIDFTDFSGEVVARIEGYECVLDASLQSAFERNTL